MTQKNDHREAPAIANWSVWGVAMVAAAAFSVALGNLAGDIVRNQGLPAGFLAQIEASREDGAWAQECPEGNHGVAINNYPGTQNLLEKTHSAYYTKSGERNWRCSHICVPRESAGNLRDYFKGATVGDKQLIVLDSPAEFNKYFKEGDEEQGGPEAAMTRAIILSSTKTSCVGPNSVDYGEIKTANEDEIKRKKRTGTAAPAEATATTGQTAAEKLARTKELAEGIRRMPGTRPPAAPGPAAPATEAPAAGESEFKVGALIIEPSEETTELQKQLKECVIAVTRLAGELGYAKLVPPVERPSVISNNFRKSEQKNIMNIADSFLEIFELAQHKRNEESLINKKDPSRWTSRDIQNAKSALGLCEQVRQALQEKAGGEQPTTTQEAAVKEYQKFGKAYLDATTRPINIDSSSPLYIRAYACPKPNQPTSTSSGCKLISASRATHQSQYKERYHFMIRVTPKDSQFLTDKYRLIIYATTSGGMFSRQRAGVIVVDSWSNNFTAQDTKAYRHIKSVPATFLERDGSLNMHLTWLGAWGRRPIPGTRENKPVTKAGEPEYFGYRPYEYLPYHHDIVPKTEREIYNAMHRLKIAYQRETDDVEKYQNLIDELNK